MNSVLNLLECAAAAFPQKTAVAYRDRSFSFAQLRDAARRLAFPINEAVGSDKAVGVFVNRGADTAALFLAAVYSGNFYVPIDPGLPVKKLLAIIEDADIRVLLGDEENRPLLQELHFDGSFLTLKDAGEASVSVPASQPDTPLYMVYTSGSTGKPKGVLKSHGAVLSYLDAFTRQYAFSSADVIGNQTPFFFDASAKDFYLMLKTGATLEILPSEFFSFPVKLISYMNERGVTFISWVPTALCIVTQLNTFMEIKPTTLRRVFFVGEVFPRKQLDKWRAALPHIEYVNLYGSSELAGICCYYPVREDLPEGAPLPLGKPLSNSRVWLMADGREITEPGVVGEIFISSPALALGYYNDPERTSASFFMMDLPDGSRVRTFRTGDMAAYDENGDLVFAARRDFQIKHQGRRIELGEIEAVADEVPQIIRCCCLYNQEKKQITLFCQLEAGCDWKPKDVRSALKGILTDYMLPGKVIVLDAMPLNANGKIDRQLLKAQLK